MVLIHVLTKDSTQASAVTEVLIKEDLVLNVVRRSPVELTEKDASGQLTSTSRTFLMAQTKALLFNKIDQRLRELYGDDMPALYSVPIVNMDWEQANQLVESITRV